MNIDVDSIVIVLEDDVLLIGLPVHRQLVPHLVAHRAIYSLSDPRETYRVDLLHSVERQLPIAAIADRHPEAIIVAAMRQ